MNYTCLIFQIIKVKKMGYLSFITGKDYVIFKFKKYQFEIFNCPGKWMDVKELKAIQSRILDITYRSCGKHPKKGLYVDTGLMKDKIIGICSRQQTDCAFNAMVCIGNYNNKKILHTGPGYCTNENKGVAVLLYFFTVQYFFIKNLFRNFYFTTITHVPKVFGVMSQCFLNMYPNEKNDTAPMKFHNAIRDMMMSSYIKEIEPEYNNELNGSFILKKFRLQKDGSLVPFPHTAENVPKHREKKYNDRCLELINYEQGDALIQVGEVGIKAYFKDNCKNFLRAFKKG